MKFTKIQPGGELPMDLSFYPPVDNPGQQHGIPGWTLETIKTMIPRKYWKRVSNDLMGNTGIISEGRFIWYWYDVIASIDFVLNKKPYEWD